MKHAHNMLHHSLERLLKLNARILLTGLSTRFEQERRSETTCQAQRLTDRLDNFGLTSHLPHRSHITMSRRTAVIEEFDDDTDLPLPSRPLPNTGAKGPLLKEISSDEEDLDTGNEPTATTSQPQQYQPRPPQPSSSQFQAPPQGYSVEKIQELYPDYKT